MSRVGLTALETALIVVVVVVGATLSALLYTQWSYYTSLQSQYNALQANYTALASKYQALKTNYTNLQRSYNMLEQQYQDLNNEYTTVEEEYNSLQSSYQWLQGQYNSLQGQYNNVSNLLNAVVAGMQGGSATDNVQPNSYDFSTEVYVPSGCAASITITVSSTGPVDVYIMGLSNVVYLLVDEYAQSIGQSPPFTWSYVYEFAGSYVSQTVTLTPTYQYGGDMYFIVIYNPNSYSVTVTANAVINHLTCTT